MKKKTAFVVCVLLLGLLCGCGPQAAPAESTETGSTDTTAVSAPSSSGATAAEPDTTSAEQSEALPDLHEAELYAEFLSNGGYEDVLSDYFDSDAEYEAEAALADINNDGVRELLMHITDKSTGGVAGFSAVTFLLGVRGGKVERQGFAYYGGGSGGGDYLFFKYDTVSKKHVLEYEEYVRDGMFFNTYALHFFDTSQIDNAQEKQYGLVGAGTVAYKDEHTVRCNTFYSEGTYAEDAARVRKESNLCKEEDGFVTAYLYDDNYISEAEYDRICARYIEPTDPAYQMKPVTLENPIPAE